MMKKGSSPNSLNFSHILYPFFSFFFKCDRKGCAIDCQGKICRYKCRCEYRFIHTYDEIHVYRQITRVWDGGTDYYTGCKLKKYAKKQSITRRYTRYQSKINDAGRSASLLDAIKKFRKNHSVQICQIKNNFESLCRQIVRLNFQIGTPMILLFQKL